MDRFHGMPIDTIGVITRAVSDDYCVVRTRRFGTDLDGQRVVKGPLCVPMAEVSLVDPRLRQSIVIETYVETPHNRAFPAMVLDSVIAFQRRR
jgi:hypothetical protein